MLGVSVVIPCYNSARFIRETLDSVLSQQYDGPLEVLVADDGSTDGSDRIVESYAPRVRLLRKSEDEPRSAARARNRCLRAATQPLVAFLDADDLWLSGHLAALASAMDQNPELGLAYDKGYYASPQGVTGPPIFREPHVPRTTPDKLIAEQCFPPAGVMVRRAAFDRVGLFDETLRHVEDHDMWLRVLEAYPAQYVPVFGFQYRQHEGQKSLKPTLWEDAAKVFRAACSRYPYRSRSIRRRHAVLTYRFSQIAWKQRQFPRGTLLLLKALALDPLRAVEEGTAYVRDAIGLRTN